MELRSNGGVAGGLRWPEGNIHRDNSTMRASYEYRYITRVFRGFLGSAGVDDANPPPSMHHERAPE
jgi:hypothetical protein